MKSLSRAITNIRRTPYQAIAAIMVLTITFFVTVAISFTTVGIYQALVYFETRPQVLIFFKNSSSQEEILALKRELEIVPEITQIDFIPQEKALELYRELNKNDPLLLELVTAEILPASLEISTISLDSLKTVADQAQRAGGVEEVVLRTDVVDILNKWLSGIRYAGTLFIAIMGLTSILIVGIVVGMKIAGKNYEIQVLRLIGASSWYIQGPFLLEGAIYGVLSSLLAYVFALITLLYSAPVVLEFSGEVPLLPTAPLVLIAILAGTVSSGMLIGTLGSWMAVKRFMHR